VVQKQHRQIGGRVTKALRAGHVALTLEGRRMALTIFNGWRLIWCCVLFPTERLGNARHVVLVNGSECTDAPWTPRASGGPSLGGGSLLDVGKRGLESEITRRTDRDGRPVPVGNSRSDILVMKAAQDGQGQRLADDLDGARDRRILLQ